ncbi:MAG: TonB-dependent receptor [Ignavibacteriaceae bacterium]
MNKIWSFTKLIILALVFVPALAFASSKIRGKVIDKSTGEPLPGANVYLENTNLGSATTIDGTYSINNVPPGNYTLQVKYLGYKPEKFDIKVTDNATLEQNVSLEYMVLEGQELVVTAQAEGQMQAINQQISSNSVKNIVSSAKIKELPEANAAEAVGRLPGISLKREGGEGNKVVIRGLSPQYNRIEINGVGLAATGPDDRSVDLSMISPYTLEGIEVSKTAMADQEANQIGGTVNFLLKDAPEAPTLSLTAQGGYNALRSKVNNYYYVASGGMRFLDNKLGLFLQGNLEKTDRSNNGITSNYVMQFDTLTLANNLNVQDIQRTNKRTGGVVVLDYRLPSTKIKLSSTVNNIDITTTTRQENFDPVGRNHNYQANYQDGNLLTLLNTLRIDQSLSGLKIVADVSYAESKTDVPKQIQMNAYENNAFQSAWSWDSYQIHPLDIVNKAYNNITNSKVNQFYGRDSSSLEQQTGANLSFEGGFKTDLADFNIRIGGEFKHKFKKYDFNQYEIPLGWQDLALARLYLTQRFGLSGYDYSNDDFPYAPFIDNNYNAGDFKAGGDYTISRVPNSNTMLDVYNEIKNLKTVNGAAVKKTLWYDYTNSNLNDYAGHENYYAAYILPTITFGSNKLVTFIPGFRYEHNETEYTANRSNGPGKPTDPFIYFAYTSSRQNNYILPMIHVKYQPFDWFDIRASYTKTLARPSYNRLIPIWSSYGSSITWNNVDLKPAQSQNLDLYFSFYTQKIGLFSFGIFQKQIKDFVFATTTFIADSALLRPEWPPTVTLGGTISGYTNSPDIAKLQGLEVEWQSNFWFLPGILKGLVVNINYTYTDSHIKYPKFVPIYVYEQKGPILVKKLVGTADQGYYDRLLDQPMHIVNVEVGFDYKGFSIRGSMQYTSDVFISNNFYEELRQTTNPLTRWDMKVRQELPIEGLQVFLNVNNISKAVYQTSNYGTGWFTNRGYYGLTADLGITYTIL